MRIHLIRNLFALGLALLAAPAAAASCQAVAEQLNRQLPSPIDARQLAATLDHLNSTGQLPPAFIGKRAAEAAGWQRGRSLWSAPALQGKSIGGDRFGNRERQLPAGRWQEADLDYQGGKRNAKRLVFSAQQRFVTVDHYRSFVEVAPCR